MKNRLKIYYEGVSVIPVSKYRLYTYDGNADIVSQTFADSLEVVESDGRKYLKCYRRGLVCDLIYLNNIDYIYYETNLAKYYSDLSIDTLGPILEKNSEKENKEND